MEISYWINAGQNCHFNDTTGTTTLVHTNYER